MAEFMLKKAFCEKWVMILLLNIEEDKSCCGEDSVVH